MEKIYNFQRKNKVVGDMRMNAISAEKAELRFYGDIVSNTWQSYWYEEDKCPQDIVDFLSDCDKYKDLDIYINSGGGNVHAGLAIYQILKRHKGKKTVHVDGIAASIASVIAFAGDKLIVPKSAQLMIHKPWSYASGDAAAFRHEAEVLDVCQRSIENIYVEHTRNGITQEMITEMINSETWMTGDKAAEIFDIEVAEGGNAVASCKSDYFDKYINTPNLNVAGKGNDEDKKNKKTLQLRINMLSL